MSLVLCALAVLACNDPTGFRDSRLTFEAVPDTIAPGDTVNVNFTLRNPTRAPRTITSSAGCLFFLRTFLDNQSVPWKGTDYACTAAITDFTIPAGDSLHYVLELVAAPAGSPASTVLPAGTYRIQATMNADLPDLETAVTVIAPTVLEEADRNPPG